MTAAPEAFLVGVRVGVRANAARAAHPPRLNLVAAVLTRMHAHTHAHTHTHNQVCVFAFDCLYHNGVSLLHEPLTTRRELLSTALVEVPGQLALATTKISNDVEELEVGRLDGSELEVGRPQAVFVCGLRRASHAQAASTVQQLARPCSGRAVVQLVNPLGQR